MGLLQRALQRTLPQVDRRIDWRVDRKLEERVLPELPRQGEALAELTTSITDMSDKLLFTMAELRRWMGDDLEAASETATLLGESLARLQTSVDRLGEEVTGIGQRLDSIEKQLARPSPTKAE